MTRSLRGRCPGPGILAWMLALPLAAAAQAPPPAAPPPHAAEDAVPLDASDVTMLFKGWYLAAGSPRVLLFWNVSFDDETQSTQATLDIRQHDIPSPHLGDDLPSRGPAEVHTQVTRTVDRAKDHPRLGARTGAVLEAAFRQRLHEVGVRLLDRSMVLRLTAAARDREGVDAKLIEADAVKGSADLLLEIVMQTDLESPLGRGFKIVATNVDSAEELTSLYTLAQPPPPPTRKGRYIATDEGFKWEPPAPWVPPADEVGVMLADEVMRALVSSSPSGLHRR
jgi:hypothetical protein